MFCENCGKEITDEKLQYCLGCGCRIKKKNEVECGKNWLYAFILNWTLGMFGAHRFYTGYIIIGAAQLLTLGGCGIWSFVDMIMLGLNKYENSQDEKLTGYNESIGIIGIVYVSLIIMLAVLGAFLALIIPALIAAARG